MNNNKSYLCNKCCEKFSNKC